MTKRLQKGFTLIELLIFILVVGVCLAGILSVMNTVVKSSADPMVRKQTLAVAESLLEEILLKDYAKSSGSTSPPRLSRCRAVTWLPMAANMRRT